MRGFLRCERCEWSRTFARFGPARMTQFCPACGHRVVRERQPSEESRAVAYWRTIAGQLSAERPPGPHEHPR